MSEERKKILDMLSEGKITVDEAERLLNAVADTPRPESDAGGGGGDNGSGRASRPGLDLDDLERQIRSRVADVRRTVKTSMPHLRTVIKDAVPDVERIVEEATAAIPGLVEEMGRTFKQAFGEVRRQAGERHSARAEREFTETAPITPGSKLSLDNSRGSIVVETTESGEGEERLEARVRVEVRAVDEAAAQSYAEGVRLEIQTGEDGVRLLPVRPPNEGGSAECLVHVHLKVPAKLDLDLSTAHGDLVVPDMDGNLLLNSRHGEARIAGATGNVSIQQQHGSLQLGRVAKSLALDAHHSRVRVEEVTEKAQVAGHHGKVSVGRIQGDLVADLQHAPFDLEEVGGQAVVNGSHGKLSLGRIGGDLSLNARHSPVDIEEVDGKAQLANNHGPIKAKRIGGDLAVQSQHGAVEIGEIGGAAVAKCNHGRLHLGRVAAAVTVDADRGQVYVGPSAGPVAVRGNRGEVVIEEPGGEVLAENSRAGIVVRASAPVRDAYTLSNNRGNIEVILPEDSDVEVQGFVRRGRVDTDLILSVSANGQGGQSVEGKLGDGSAALRVEVSEGNLVLKKTAGTGSGHD
jgi:DUF4097 and DUF4098 domain-containing protein YvlB